MAASESVAGTSESSLADRVLTIVSRRGYVGITRDELLRKLGVAYEELMATLDDLHARGMVRVHWPTPESFRVFYTG